MTSGWVLYPCSCYQSLLPDKFIHQARIMEEAQIFGPAVPKCVCFMYICILKTDESTGFVKGFSFRLCSAVLPVTPGFRWTINVLDTVAFSVFFIICLLLLLQ